MRCGNHEITLRGKRHDQAYLLPRFLAGFFLAVLAAFLKAEALGAPLVPALRIVSPDPALMRLRLAWILL
jgi:hypothetical protein